MAVPPLTRNKIQLVLRADKTKTDYVHRQKVISFFEQPFQKFDRERLFIGRN